VVPEGRHSAPLPEKRTAGPGSGQQKLPIARQVNYSRTVQGQDASRLVPIPVLTVVELESAKKRAFANFPTAVQIKKRFALGYHGAIVGDSATPGYRVQAGHASCSTGHKFFRKHAAAVILAKSKVRT
jgi:hypothetical protein